jgi:superfamily II DNA or RNA helicase
MSIQDKNCVLTSKGYAVKKSYLNEIQIQSIRSELTMAPKVMDKYQKDIQNFPIYAESKTRFYVPRHWGIKRFGKPEANIVSEGLELPESVLFKGTPRDFQKDIINTFLESEANGLICVPCGYGKSVIGLNIITCLRRRTLIVVDKEFLMNQWKSEIENFIQGARVGILQANKIETDSTKYDITICMIQTICRRDFPEGFFDEYGFTIFDECHHLGASYFCKTLFKIQTKYILGLSATPNRDDGLDKVFEYYIGDYIIKQTQRAPDKDAIVKAVWFDSEDSVYKDVPVNWRGEPITAKLLNQVADFETRNKKIMTLIEEYAKDKNRNILVLSDRISQLEWFEKALSSCPSQYNFGYYIGGIKQSKLDENAEKCQILLATYQMASEGFSIKKLNTVILATPRKKVEQSSGRIFRQRIDERLVVPHIVDIIDSHTMFVNRWYVRQKFYKDCEYNIIHIDKPKKVVPKIEANEHGSLFKF